MEDHHVDRPGVEVQQCMKLTGTNRSIGLIAFTNPSRAAARAGRWPDDGQKDKKRQDDKNTVKTRFPFIDGLVVIAGVPAPDPIPNSAVKAPSADGTAS